MTTLEENLTAFAQRAGAEDRALRSMVNGKVGDLTALTTTAKASLVAAVNELQAVLAALDTGVQIDDDTARASTVYSSARTTELVEDRVASLVGSAPATLDTLNELAAALGNDPAFATTVSTAIGNRVRVDAAQGLAEGQRAQARTNIGAAAQADLDDLDVALALRGLPGGGDPGQVLTRDGEADYGVAWADVEVPDAAALSGSPKSGNVRVSDAFRMIRSVRFNSFGALALCADKSLFAVWRDGPGHGVDLGGNLMWARSTDYGATWLGAQVMLADATVDQRDPSLRLLSDGRLALTYYKSTAATPAVQGSVVRFSTDHGVTWGPEVPVTFGFTSWNAINGVVELADGALLAYGYGVDAGGTNSTTSTRVVRSTDGGATWGPPVTIASYPVDARPYNESEVAVLPNGTLYALVRSDNGSGAGAGAGLYSTTSADGGLTWSAPTLRLSGWGRPSLAVAASGALIASFREMGTSQRPHMVATSWNNGVTWSTPTRLHYDTTTTQSVYSQMVQVAPGQVAILYCDEAGTAGTVRFRYLLDGDVPSPLNDPFVNGAAIDLPLHSSYQSHGTVLNLPAFRAADYSVRDGYVEVSSGWLSPTATTPINAGQTYTGLYATLPEHLCPDRTVFGVGFINLGGALAFCQVRVSPEGIVTFASTATGNLTVASNSYVAHPPLRWRIRRS